MVNHPGVILLQRLEEHGMTQKELALRTGVSEKHVSTIVSTEKKVSTTYARKLGYVFPDDDWLGLQYEFDKEQIRIQKDHSISDEEISVLKNLKEVIPYLIEQGFIHNQCSDAEKVLQLRTFFGVSDLLIIPSITFSGAYRAQLKKYTVHDEYVIGAWQRICEKKTDLSKLGKGLDTDLLKERLNALRQISNSDFSEALPSVQKILEDCGIAFNIVRSFRGAPVQGFMKKVSGNKAMLCLTIRGKRADSFWFTLFHEIGHILNGDFTKRLLDLDAGTTSSAEKKANQFARDLLIDPDLYREFVLSGQYESWPGISEFAKKIEIPSYIVLGRLQNDGYLEWSDYPEKVAKIKDGLLDEMK